MASSIVSVFSCDYFPFIPSSEVRDNPKTEKQIVSSGGSYSEAAYWTQFEEAKTEIYTVLNQNKILKILNAIFFGITSLESYINCRAIFWNEENPDNEIDDSAKSKIDFSAKCTSWIPIMLGPFERPTCVGWVYWGRTAGDSADRVHVSRGNEGCTRQGIMEKQVLIHRGAFRILQEQITTLAADPPGTGGQSCLFEGIRVRLRAAGIAVVMSEGTVSFSFTRPEGEVIDLPPGLRHPWISGRGIEAVGVLPGVVGGEELTQVCHRFGEIEGAPESLRRRKLAQVDAALRWYFDNLLTFFEMLIGSRVRLSGRGMIALGSEISIHELGIPETIARGLFGRDPSGTWILDSAEDTPEGTPAVIEELTERMADAWVLVNRAPTMEDTAIIALHPVFVEGAAVRFNPCLCRWLNADFDGDSVAGYVPCLRGGPGGGGALAIRGGPCRG